MNKKFAVVLATCMVITIFTTSAYAWSVLFMSKSLPGTATRGYDSTFSATIKYDSTVYGIPTPVDGQFHIEIPRLFELPRTYSGSWSSFDWTARTGSMTNKSVWQSSKTFYLFGEIEKSASIKAKAVSSGSSQSYIGTGPGMVSDADYFKSVTVY